MRISEQLYWSSTPRNLATAAAIGVVVVIPIAILEWMNTQGFQNGVPVALFGFLWLLTIAFILILVPMLRAASAGNGIAANPGFFAPRIVMLLLIAWMWISVVVDQMPCFLGVPNCD